MEITREKTAGIAGTILFAILLLLILMFSYFTLALPPQELEGIPVMFGNVDEAFGSTESPKHEITPEPTPAPTPAAPKPTPNEPLITQKSEPSIEIAERREAERRQTELVEQRRREEEAERRRREQEEAKKREINQKMSGLFGENAGNRGETQGSGTQGVSTGNATEGAKSGIGGIGTYDLGGRSVGPGGLIQPKYSVNDYGTVVVNITVDPNGNVIKAEIGKGTNTPNTALLNEARRAALRTKFNAINSTNNQQGTITYKFDLKLP